MGISGFWWEVVIATQFSNNNNNAPLKYVISYEVTSYKLCFDS